MNNILLKNGLLYSGRENRFLLSDLLFSRGGCIEHISPGISSADDVIDCTGLAVSSGFIDCHGHSDDIPMIELIGKYREELKEELLYYSYHIDYLKHEDNPNIVITEMCDLSTNKKEKVDVEITIVLQ